MMKQVAIGGVAFVVCAITAYNGFSSAATGPDHLVLPEALAAHAAEANKRRKERWGDASLERAFVQGNTIVFDMIIDKAPRVYDVRAANARLQSLMEKRFCNSKVTPLLKRGAGLVFRYSTSGGRALIDGRVDANACRLT